MAKSLDLLLEKSRFAMILGIGGGGDVVGTIPTSRYLRWLGIQTIIGGLTWERYVNDPEPGPRKMDEIVEIERLSATVGLANEKTRTTKGVRFTESAVAEAMKERIVLVDPNKGVQGVVDGLNEAIEKLGIDLFIGVDVGGDVIASGSEEGLHSMLADSMLLAAMVNLKVPAVLGVLGGCTDGELTLEQFNKQVSKIASHGGLLGARSLTPEDVEVLEKVIPYTKTEPSALAVKAARGYSGEFYIRGGYRKVVLTPISTLTFYFDPEIVYNYVSRVAKDLTPTRSLDEAQAVLDRVGLPSELTFERKYGWRPYVGKDKPFEKGQG